MKRGSNYPSPENSFKKPSLIGVNNNNNNNNNSKVPKNDPWNHFSVCNSN